MKNQAFTLIELIIVIALLGILAATALPRFVDFSGDARQAAAEQVAGAFQTAVKIAHSNWVLKGEPATIDYPTRTLGFSPLYGYPECTTLTTTGTHTNTFCVDGSLDNVLGAHECADVWNAVLGDGQKALRNIAYWDNPACGSDADCKYSVTQGSDGNGNYCDFTDVSDSNNVIRWYTNSASKHNQVIFQP